MWLPALALLLASCSPDGYRESDATATAGSVQSAESIRPPSGPVIRVLGLDSRPLRTFERLKVKYESAAGLHIEVTKRHPLDALIAEVERELSSGRETYDLVLVPHRVLGKFVEKGYVRSLDTYFGDHTVFDRRLFDLATDLPGRLQEVSSYRGRPYGYPFLARPMSLWFRTDLFDEDEASRFYQRFRRPLAPPKTWREYEDIGQFFHRPQQGLYGTVIQGRRDVSLWAVWLQFVQTFGARILDTTRPDEYGDIVVNSPAAVSATEFYVRLLRLSPPDALDYDAEGALRAFQQERVALSVMWHDSAPSAEDQTESRVAGRIGYAPIPTAVGHPGSLLEIHTLLIPQHAPHPREAFQVMQWALSHEIQVAQTLNGGLSARQSTYEDPRIKESRHLYLRTFPSLMAGAVPLPTIPEVDQIVGVMTPELSRLVAGEVTVKSGLDRIARWLEEILKGKARLRHPPPIP